MGSSDLKYGDQIMTKLGSPYLGVVLMVVHTVSVSVHCIHKCTESYCLGKINFLVWG